MDDQPARKAAFIDAVAILHNAMVQFETEDVLIVADWLLTGTATLALQFSAQRTDNYLKMKEG